MSLAETILASATELRECTVSELILTSWKKDFMSFGLAGYEEEYPCSHTFRGALDGRRGLIRQGYLRKINGSKMVITDLGQERLKQLILLREEKKPRRTTGDDSILNHCLATAVYSKPNNWTLADLREFFRLKNSRGGRKRIDKTLKALARLQDSERGSEARVCLNLGNMLLEKLEKQLALFLCEK